MYGLEPKRLIAFSFVIHHCLILSNTSALDPIHQTWRRDPAFDDRLAKADQYDASDHELLMMSSKAQCAVTCAQRTWCRSLFYSKMSGHCHLHAVLFSGNTNTTDEEGVRYYKTTSEESQAEEVSTAAPCVSPFGYSQESYSGLCYKILMTTRLEYDQARLSCLAVGGDLITLNTVDKLRGMAATIYSIYNISVVGWVSFWIGASRPQAQWNTPFTNNIPVFEWDRTGESLMPLYQAGYFNEDYSSGFYPGDNCVAMHYISDYYYQNFTHFQLLMPGTQIAENIPVCELL